MPSNILPDLSTLVVSSHNRGKLREITELLGDYAGDIVPVSSFSSVSPIEEASSFTENALIKARHGFAVSGYSALSDDSGLEIEFLGGQPGLHSARFARKRGGFQKAMEDIILMLEGEENRKARFVCALALVGKEGEWVFEGEVIGNISQTFSPAKGGFGYDPIFIPKGYNLTFAEFPEQEKNLISHRGRAFKSLLEELKIEKKPK